MKKIKVTFEEEIKINGRRTTPHSDGNNGRHVYINGDYVLKVDDRGYRHHDLATWKRIKRKDRKYFVPTLAEGENNGKHWSIQPYVDLDWEVTDEAREIVEDLYHKYALNDLDYYDEPRNWAINAKTGDPVIFDYGLGQDS
jgi:hypothetical protein